jgi:hypothetical protein
LNSNQNFNFALHRCRLSSRAARDAPTSLDFTKLPLPLPIRSEHHPQWSYLVIPSVPHHPYFIPELQDPAGSTRSHRSAAEPALRHLTATPCHRWEPILLSLLGKSPMSPGCLEWRPPPTLSTDRPSPSAPPWVPRAWWSPREHTSTHAASARLPHGHGPSQ